MLRFVLGLFHTFYAARFVVDKFYLLLFFLLKAKKNCLISDVIRSILHAKLRVLQKKFKWDRWLRGYEPWNSFLFVWQQKNHIQNERENINKARVDLVQHLRRNVVDVYLLSFFLPTIHCLSKLSLAAYCFWTCVFVTYFTFFHSNFLSLHKCINKIYTCWDLCTYAWKLYKLHTPPYSQMMVGFTCKKIPTEWDHRHYHYGFFVLPTLS